MKKVTSLFAILLFSTVTFAQEKGYKFTIPNNTTMAHKTKTDHEFTDVYTVHTDSTNEHMKYILSITSIGNTETTFEEVLSNSFKEGYEKKCDCTITQDEHLDYKHFKAARYGLKFLINGVSLLGYSINTWANNTVYSITFIVPGTGGLEAYDAEFSKITNSFELN